MPETPLFKIKDFQKTRTIVNRAYTNWHTPANLLKKKLCKTRTTRTSAFWDTPRRSMITNTRDSHQIPSQNKTKSNFEILQVTLYASHLLNLLDKMCKYEMDPMDPTRTAGATERTRDAVRTDGWRDGRRDGRTEWNQYIPPNNFIVWEV